MGIGVVRVSQLEAESGGGSRGGDSVITLRRSLEAGLGVMTVSSVAAESGGGIRGDDSVIT